MRTFERPVTGPTQMPCKIVLKATERATVLKNPNPTHLAPPPPNTTSTRRVGYTKARMTAPSSGSLSTYQTPNDSILLHSKRLNNASHTYYAPSIRCGENPWRTRTSPGSRLFKLRSQNFAPTTIWSVHGIFTPRMNRSHMPYANDGRDAR